MSDHAGARPPLPSDGRGVNLAGEQMFIELSEDGFVDVPELGLQVRDLGLGALTNGAFAAQVFRASPTSGPFPGHWHMHNLDIQVGYVVSGWVKYEFDGVGIRRFGQGTCIVHVPRNRLRMTDSSEDFEGIWFKSPPHETVTFWQFDADTDSYAESLIDVALG